MSLRVKLLFISLVVLIVPVLFFSCSNKYTSTFNSDISDKRFVLIDAGHGGEDGGAVSVTGALEKDINLSIAKKLKQLLIINGYDVVMTRSDDVSLSDENLKNGRKLSDLKNRVDLFNYSKNNIVISIHQNNFTDSKYSGTQVFYSNNNQNSVKLAECIKNSVVTLLQKDNSRECKKADSSIYVLDNAEVPAVLVECGFLSNENEARLLENDEYQNKIAYCLFLGFQEYYYKNYF